MKRSEQKKVYRQKLINLGFIFMFIWTMFFTALAVIGTVVIIIDSDFDNWVPMVAGGIMAVIGWITFAPMLIHRKKVVVKDDKIIAHIPQRWLKERLTVMWEKPIEWEFLRNGFTPHSMGRFVRFSWRAKNIELIYRRLLKCESGK